MYCTQCGNKLKKKEQFCPNCGKNIDEPVAPQVVGTSVDGDKSKKSAIIVVIVVIALIILGILALVGIVVAIVFFALGAVEQTEHIDLLGYEVPTVYKATGERVHVCGIKSHSDLHIKTVEYDYCNNLGDDDVKEYFDYLIKNEGFVRVDDASGTYLEKKTRELTYTVVLEDNDRIVYKVLMVNDRSSERERV